MRILVFYNKKRILDYINNDNNHNKIPYSFEIISTLILCPSCNNKSIIERSGYFPSIDSFCYYSNCHHTIEVKSILAEGKQKNAYESIPFDVKLGSPSIYNNITKNNKSLMIFWYNIIYSDNNITVLNIRNCILYSMEHFNEGFNCIKEIVFQRKKKDKLKERLNLKIFPEFSIFKELTSNDFNIDYNIKRIEQIKEKYDYNLFMILKSPNKKKKNK